MRVEIDHMTRVYINFYFKRSTHINELEYTMGALILHALKFLLSMSVKENRIYINI